MSAPSNISPTAFDGEAAWAALPPRAQARVGAAALELGVAMAIVEHADYPARRAGDEACALAGDLLREAVVGYDGVPESAWWEGTAEAGTFRLPTCLGMVCRACGCSHNDACPEGCGWAEDGLCTACAALPPGGVVVAGETREEPVFPAQAFTLTPLPDGWIGRDGKIVRDGGAAPGDRDLPGLPPVGRGLGALARAIETMHEGPDA